jgi:hypothetical protein
VKSGDFTSTNPKEGYSTVTYIDPSEVTSPQANVSDVRPIVDGREDSWSAALLKWNELLAVGLRWNGGGGSEGQKPSPGNPQSRGLPTWFILPDEIAAAVLHALAQYGLGGGKINKAQAIQWVKEALQKLDGPDPRSEEFAKRVKKVVMAMKESGEI